MKRLIITCIIGTCYLQAYGQIPTYKWVTGGEFFGNSTTITKTEPGPREGASSFKDQEGNYWIYGGFGRDKEDDYGNFGDMWKYDLSTRTWHWMDGNDVVERYPEDNRALSFDGINDEIVIEPNPIDYTGNFTIEAWFKTTADGVILAHSPWDAYDGNIQSWSLSWQRDGQLWLDVGSSNGVRADVPDLRDDQWHHVAVTIELNFDGEHERIQFYVDGQVVGNNNIIPGGTEENPWEEFDFDAQLDQGMNYVTKIGYYNIQMSYFYRPYNGQLDEVRIWDHLRTESEIKSYYNMRMLGSEEGLVAYFDFDQGVRDYEDNRIKVLEDRTGNANDGDMIRFSRASYFQGEMAEMRIWNRTFTPEEIVENAKSTVVGNEANLIAAFGFAEGTPHGDNSALTNIDDLTTNNHDGQFINFELGGSSSNYTDASVPVYPDTYFNQAGARRAELHDVNGDTHLDILTPNYYNYGFTVLINDGSGQFNSWTDNPLSAQPISFSTGFINGDAHIDVAVCTFNEEEAIEVYFGDGAGSFTHTTQILPEDGAFPYGSTIQDFNGDMNADIAVSLNGLGVLRVYFGDGAGNFNTSSDFAISGGPRDLVMGNLNGDAHMDIAILSNGDQVLDLLLGDGIGGFTNGVSLPISGDPRDVIVADINDDGNTDLIASCRNTNSIHTFTGNGDGTFNTVAVVPSNNVWGIAAEDFNADNIVDLVACNRSDGEVTIFNGDNTGQFYEVNRIDIANGTPTPVVIGDLNKDGFDDLAVGNMNNYSVTIINGDDNNFDITRYVNTLNFDGLDDYVQFSSLNPYDASWTWEAWVKTTTDGPLFSFSEPVDWDPNEFTITISIVDGIPSVDINEWAFYAPGSPTGISDGEWHHLAVMVVENGNGANEVIEIFQDGQSIYWNDGDDFDEQIRVGDANFTSKIGATTLDETVYVDVNQHPNSNWQEGVSFPTDLLGRAYNAYWEDASGDFYIFGGTSIWGPHNSVYKYNKSTQEWELLNGDGNAWATANYGTKGIEDMYNIPSVRWEVRSTTDDAGNAWFFGGFKEVPDHTADGQQNDLWKYNMSTNSWTWVSGSELINQPGIYGQMGVADVLNIPGGREDSRIWYSNDGFLWIFGGWGYDINGDVGQLNDLWKYDITNDLWTWMSGSSTANAKGIYGQLGEYGAENVPGAREATTTWKDSNGIFWLFGGRGYDKFGLSIGDLNDLWSYDPGSNMWAWQDGSNFANSTGSYDEQGASSTEYVPGARVKGNAWIGNSDELWLFGGNLGNAFYNDFWKYNQQSKQWAWLNGLNSTGGGGDYGSYGELDAGSIPHPGARHGSVNWVDHDGDFWMLGGNKTGQSSLGNLNDLWKYEPDKNIWTYKGGSIDPILNEGSYGAKGIGSDTNVPKSRWHGASWVAEDGKLWFFGGLTHDPNIEETAWLNDMWFYDPESQLYVWMSGNSGYNQAGLYGTKGESSTSKIPGARSSSAFWSDQDGNMWIFGGYESFEYNNDLWKFNPNTLEWTWVSGNNFQNTPSFYGELGVANPENLIGSRRYMSGWTDANGDFWIFGGHGIDGQGQLGTLNDMWKFEVSSETWIWMGGDNYRYSLGNYGELGVESADNLPPARYGYGHWKDDSGNFWIYGGFGRDANEFGEYVIFKRYADLWKYNIRTKMWTWVGGSQDVNISAEYNHPQGQFGQDNVIGARERINVFKGDDKQFWAFGGRLASGNLSYNDLWEIRFIPGVPYVDNPSEIGQTHFSFFFDEAWARDYDIEVSELVDFSTTVASYATIGPESTVSNLSPGTEYHYRVKAANEIGASANSSSLQLLTLPATPAFELSGGEISGLTSTAVSVNWQATPGIFDGYQMDVSEDGLFENGELVHADYNLKAVEASALNQTIDDLKPGTRYYVRMQSINATGVSPFSERIDFLTTPATPEISNELVITELSQNSLVLNWNRVPEIMNGYLIEVSTDETFEDYEAYLPNYMNNEVAKDRTSLIIEGLSAGTQYYARLSSFNASGSSSPTATIPILTLPEAPIFSTDVALSNITQHSAEITWEAVPEIFDGYHVEVSIDPDFTNNNFFLPDYGRNDAPKVVAKDVTTELIDGLIPGRTYYVRVRAFNASGDSPNSNIIKVVTVPRAPAINPVGNITQNSASLSWSKPVGATSFLLDLNTADDFGSTTTVIKNFPLAVAFEIFDDLEAGIRYYARVQSSNESGNSGDMETPDYSYVNFITIPANPSLDDGPSSVGQTTITLDWDDIIGADGYEIDVSDNFFQTFLAGYNAVPLTESMFEITGLDAGESYQARVRANNESGSSDYYSLYTLLTIPGTPIARDATNSSASVFTANWDPVNGADYYAVEVSADNFETFHFLEEVHSSNPLQMTGLTPGLEYRYRIKAGNSAGESPYSEVISVVAQNTAASLNISKVEFETEFVSGQSATPINITLAGGLSNPEVTMRHKGILSSEWSSFIPVIGSGTAFSFEITASMLDDVGVDFEIQANDGVTFVTSEDHQIAWTFSDTQSEILPIASFGGGAGDWQMISIPYVLEDNLIASIFNELGALKYRSQWRLVHYDKGTFLDAGEGLNKIDLGKSYWFNAVNEIEIDVGAGGANTDIPFLLTLNEGWNQIGNPYNVPLDWRSILNDNSLRNIVGDLMIFNQEEQEFQSTTTMTPFSGAFVFSDSERVLELSPIVNGSSGRVGPLERKAGNIDDDNWTLPIYLNAGLNQIDIGGVGMQQDANEGKDRHDLLTVPRFYYYTEFYTTRADYFYPYFSTDVVDVTALQVWDFNLESNIVSGKVHLSWDNSLFSDSQAKLWLVDENKGVMVDMSESSTYQFHFDGHKNFTIHYATDPDYKVQPKNLVLGDAFPNPTNDRTKFPVFLPKRMNQYALDLSVYNIEGRKVATVAHGMYDTGYHEIEWDVSSDSQMLKSGIYIYRLTIGNGNNAPIQKKLVISR